MLAKSILIIAILAIPITGPIQPITATPESESWRVSVDQIVPPWTPLQLDTTLEITNEADQWLLEVQRNTALFQTFPRKGRMDQTHCRLIVTAKAKK